MVSKKLPLSFVAFLVVSTALLLDLPASFFILQVSAQSGDAYRYRVLAQSNDARKAEADRLLQLGIEQFQTSQFEAGLQSWQQALDIYQEIKDHKGEGAALGNLGAAYLTMADYPKAIEYQQRSLKIAQKIKNRKGEGQSLGNLGIAYDIMGNYPEAIKHYEQYLKIAQEIKDLNGEGRALGNLGIAYGSMGDYPKAIEYQQQSLKIFQEIKDRDGEGRALGNIGNAYGSMGDYPKAIEYQQRSLKIAQEIKDRQGEGQSLGDLGNIYLSMGDYPKAIEYQQQRLKIDQEIKDRQGEGIALGHLGNVYLSMEDYPKAIEYQQQSMKIAQEIKDRDGEGRALGNIGIAYGSMGDYSKSIEYYQRSLKIFQKIKNRGGEGAVLGNIGRLYYHLGDYPKAIEYQQQSLKIAQEIKDREKEGISLNNLGFAYYKVENFQLAESTLFSAIRVLESLRGELKDSNKITIFDTQRNTYINLQNVLISQKKTGAALEIAERGRARAFAELLISKLSSKPNEQIFSPPNIDKIKQISKSQNATLVQYSIIYDDFQITNKIQSKESELYIWVIKPTGEIIFRKKNLKPLWQQQNTSLEDTIVETLKSLGSNINSRSSSSSFELGDFVKPNETLNEFTSDAPWKVVVVDRQNQIVKIQSSDRKQEHERKFTEVTKVPYAYAANKNLQELHKILIEPIADSLPKNSRDRVIFIPQGSLFFVPFPALQDANRNYLIKKHTIQTSPSIQVLDLTWQQRQKLPRSNQNQPKEVLVVGNPTMPSVSPFPGATAVQLNSLPYSEEEAKQVARLFKTDAIVGNKATKSAILPLFPKARIIHLATHGLLDDFTGRSIPGAIALAPEPLNKGKDGGINGLLTASEIFDLQLNNTELVVLSACDTGRGKITGDGVIGLSRSFISAGVPSVIVSLWSIPDDSTALLMTEFYKLQQGNDKASALRQAMLTTMEKNPDPKHWAAFTLIGETK